MTDLQKEFELATLSASWVNSDVFPDLKVYTPEYVKWLESKVEAMRKPYYLGKVPTEPVEVVGGEEFFCQNVIHHTCKHFGITGCDGCEVKKFQAK